MTNAFPNWWKYTGSGEIHPFDLPKPPAWRQFISAGNNANRDITDVDYYNPEVNINTWTPDEIHRATTFQATHRMIELVNAALYLRRPLLITGKPGTGKSSLAYAVAYELQLGQVLTWPVTSRSTLQDALYRYDALGRLQDTNLENMDSRKSSGTIKPKTNSLKHQKPNNIGQYIRLGPLGTALLPTRKPQVLLIDEIDKSSIDLPNDLLHIFETGRYEIPELSRLHDNWIDVLPQFGEQKVRIHHGKITCGEFPFVIITSNGERDLPPPFLRRCIRLDIKDPSPKQLAEIARRKFPQNDEAMIDEVMELFTEHRKSGGILATDQLLNAIYLRMQDVNLLADLDILSETDNEDAQGVVIEKLADAILRKLNEQG